jgi:hypothetical protein
MVGARHGMCELTARRGRGKAWEQHEHDVLRVNRPSILPFDAIACNVCYRQKHVLNLNKTTIRNFPFVPKITVYLVTVTNVKCLMKTLNLEVI